MLEDLKKLSSQQVVAWQVATYAQLVPPLLNALKSITGKTFTTYRDYAKWWDQEGAKFEVID